MGRKSSCLYSNLEKDWLEVYIIFAVCETDRILSGYIFDLLLNNKLKYLAATIYPFEVYFKQLLLGLLFLMKTSSRPLNSVKL